MKKTLIAFAALALMSASAIAKNDNTPPPFEQGGGTSSANASAAAAALAASQATSSATGGAGGHGGHGGHGGAATATGGSATAAGGTASADNSQTQQATSTSGGNTLSNAGNNAAQNTSNTVTVQGDKTESNTPPVVAGVLPSVPTTCRLYLFGGASTRDGAGSGTFPIGNDQTCLSIAKLNLMERAGGFTQAEKQSVVCKVEGMNELATCQAVAK